MLLQWVGPLEIPGSPPADLAVAPNFERFDGLDEPHLDNPAGVQGDRSQGGAAYGPGPRPGQQNQPTGQEYTPGPITGLVGVLGGQPLPVSDRIHRPAGSYTGVATNVGLPHRLGIGQRGPSALGADQTVKLAEITNNPPQPGDLTAIIGGWG